MQWNREEILRQEQLSFIGKLLAEYTHGARNYLAAIRESAGLMDDLLEGADQWSGEDREQLVSTVSIIEKQVKTLIRKNQDLGRFAQRMGTAVSVFDPAEIIEEAVSFFGRFVNRHEVSLRSEVSESLPSLCSDPVQIHLLVFSLINHMLERVGRGAKIVLRAGMAERELMIAVEGYGSFEGVTRPAEEAHTYWSLGQKIVADLGGRLERSTVGSDMERTTLFLPTKKAHNASKM